MRVSPNLASLIFGGAEQNRIPNSGHSRTRESSTDSAKRKSVRKACHHRHLGGLVGKTVWLKVVGRRGAGGGGDICSEKLKIYDFWATRACGVSEKVSEIFAPLPLPRTFCPNPFSLSFSLALEAYGRTNTARIRRKSSEAAKKDADEGWIRSPDLWGGARLRVLCNIFILLLAIFVCVYCAWWARLTESCNTISINYWWIVYWVSAARCQYKFTDRKALVQWFNIFSDRPKQDLIFDEYNPKSEYLQNTK